jgi:hypothetical protein
VWVRRLDAGGCIWKMSGMKNLSAAILSLLVLALLPWGAFGHAYPARASDMAQMAVEERAAQTTIAEAAPQRRCHGPALPGYPCQHDHAVPPAGIDVPAGGRASLSWPGGTPALQGIEPPGLLDPPRKG